jgi:uncharacterized protein (TIGR02246 family)
MKDEESAVRNLYQQILAAWNRRDAAGMASHFEENGNIVGFDGSQVDSRRAIEIHLRPIFADHPTATYVAKIREIRALAPTVAMLRAVAGMVPPNGDDLNPALNAVQTLVVTKTDGRWRASLFQNTPAAWHHRPHDTAALLEELREVKRRGVVVS